MNLEEMRHLERLAPRLRVGAVKGLRLYPYTWRSRGRDQAMGFDAQGRLSDYSPLMSYVLGEPTYRFKEVSPRFDLVIVVGLTGERVFDSRIRAVAHAWAYLAVEGLHGGVAVLPGPQEDFRYQPRAREMVSIQSSLASLGDSCDGGHGASTEQIRRLSGCIGTYYEGAHVVVVGAYWEVSHVHAWSRSHPYGLTHHMVEKRGLTGSRLAGGTLPVRLIDHRLGARRESLELACKAVRANLFVCTRKDSPVGSLVRRLEKGRTL